MIKQRKYFDAIQHYEAATQIFTQDADMHEALASLYYTQNLNDESLVEYTKVLELAPDRFKIHTQMADLYGRLGDTDSQYEHLKSAFLNQTDSLSSSIAENKILAIAKKEINKKHYSSANLKLVLVLSKNPQNITASYILANLYKINKKYDRAESVYYQILALRPIDLETRSLLANLYLDSSKHDNAITEFEKIVSIASGSNLGKEAKSKLNVLLLEKADKLVSEATTEEDLASILEIAINWLEKDYYEASQWLLSNINQRQPENAEASYWLGELYLEKGETKPGIEYIYNAAKLDSKNMEYRLRLGQALADSQLYDEAVKHLKSIIKATKNGELRDKAKREIVHASGRILIQKKKHKQAYKHFKDAQKLHKSGFNLDIAESLILLRRYKDAQALLTKITEQDNQNYKAHGLIARIHKENGDIKKHLHHLDKAWIGIPGEGLKESSVTNLGLKEGFNKLQSKTWGDAIIAFNRALSRDPNNLYAILGKHVALTNSGNAAEAEIVMKNLMREKERTMKAKIKFLEVRSLVSQ